jgi:hypothetical protein
LDCGGWDTKYTGYINEKGQRHGVGIAISSNGKDIGEWQEDKLHGIAKKKWNNLSIWGHFY